LGAIHHHWVFFRTKGIYTEIYVHLKWGWKIGMERSFQTNPIVPIGSIHTGVGQKFKTLGPTDCSSYWQTLMTWPFPYPHVSVAWIPS
jgi:hypothetical protein